MHCTPGFQYLPLAPAMPAAAAGSGYCRISGMPKQDNSGEPPAGGLMAWFRHAFAVEKYDEDCLSAEDKAILTKVANRVHEKNMTAATILWVESHRNLNFIGSQLMVFSQPFFDMTHPLLNAVLNRFGVHIPPADFPKLAAALEKRYSIEYFVQQLERLSAEDYNNKSPNTQAASTAADAGEEKTAETTTRQKDKD